MTQEENFRHLSINLGKNGPVRDRSDFNDALTTLNRLHQESGERQLRQVPILEMPAMALIIEFFLQLVAMERFLVELMTINKKVQNWTHVRSDMTERWDPLCAVFSQNLRCVDFEDFFEFVAVRSFTTGSLLQPTGGVNTHLTPSNFKVSRSNSQWIPAWLKFESALIPSLDLRVLPGPWSHWLRRELCRPSYNCSFEMITFRNSIRNGTECHYQWRKSIWWHLGRIVQT